MKTTGIRHLFSSFLRRQVKNAANKILERYDQRIVQSSRVPSRELFFSRLCAHGLRPRTVFDIGVAKGTPWLYEAFPEAQYFLVDPTHESLPHMKRWAGKLRAEVFNVALGAQETTAEIRAHANIEQSTLFDDGGRSPVVAKYEVPVRRFDAIIGEFARPALCKIDVQGAEASVLQGMGQRLREIDAFIIEASPLPPFVGGPDLYAVMSLMHGQGYALCDILRMYRRPFDQALAQIDVAFVPCTSPLRQGHRQA